jgi:hypothetical protein
MIENTPSRENKREEHACRITASGKQETKAKSIVLLQKPLERAIRCVWLK